MLISSKIPFYLVSCQFLLRRKKRSDSGEIAEIKREICAIHWTRNFSMNLVNKTPRKILPISRLMIPGVNWWIQRRIWPELTLILWNFSNVIPLCQPFSPHFSFLRFQLCLEITQTYAKLCPELENGTTIFYFNQITSWNLAILPGKYISPL